MGQKKQGEMKDSTSVWRYIRSGAVAGAVSAFTFVIIHHLVISNIWFSLPLMVVAGAICGLCVAWTYGLLFEAPSAGSWLRYNLLYVAMFVLLGAVSVIVYEPVTTIAALVLANAPPDELFQQAMPMTVVFTLTVSTILSLLYGRKWTHYLSILLTCTILVLLLGLNVSTIGLVDIPSGSVYLVIELFALILALNLVFVAMFIALERKTLISGSAGDRSLF